jgi:putative ABC transport system permease protein
MNTPHTPRALRLLLRLLPRRLRQEIGDDVRRQFADERAQTSGHPVRTLRLWTRTAADIAAQGLAERWSGPTTLSPMAPVMTTPYIPRDRSAWWDGFRWDVRVGARRLFRAPGFTAVTVLTLALGIGANCAIFSVVNGVLLKPLPFPESDRLVSLAQVWEGKNDVFSPPNFIDVEKRAKTLAAAAAYNTSGKTLTGAGDPARLTAAIVSAHFFDTLRVAPALGRTLTRDDNEVGHTDVVVLSDHVWRTRFGADRSILNRSITLDGASATVVGVMPADFDWPFETDCWTPQPYTESYTTKNRGAWYLDTVARLAPGATIEQAVAEIHGIGRQLEQEYPTLNTHVEMTAAPLLDSIVSDTRSGLLMLLAAVGFLLLIACVNVANLLLARAATRDEEMSVAVALGASRGRLVRQMLTESALLATLGGVAGLAAGWTGVRLLVAAAPPGIPRLSGMSLDPVVLGFALAVTLVTGVLFGLAPALQVSSRRLTDALRERSQSTPGGARGRRVRTGLVIVEMALAVLLLVGAGLLVRSFVRLLHVDPGFKTDNALTFRLGLPGTQYKDDAARREAWTQISDAIRSTPGVIGTGLVMLAPPTPPAFNLTFSVTGRPPYAPGSEPVLEIRVADPQYFAVMGIAARRGRLFTSEDRAGSTQVVAITESAARKYFPDEDPIGKHIDIGWGRDGGHVQGDVVGVVADVRSFGLDRAAPAQLYVPLAQVPEDSMAVVVRTGVPPETMFSAIRAAVGRVDPRLPVTRLETMDEHVARSVASRRFYMWLLALFAAIALALAAIGIFGVLSYLVAQRTREIGIRVALGADRRAVTGLVLRQAMLIATMGVGLGLAGSVGLTRLMTSMLFDLTPTDAPTFTLVGIGLLAVALVAAWWPVRRALAVDPLAAVRN